jgi:hypothetical protein
MRFFFINLYLKVNEYGAVHFTEQHHEINSQFFRVMLAALPDFAFFYSIGSRFYS